MKQIKKILTILTVSSSLLAPFSIEAFSASVKSAGMADAVTAHPIDSMAGAYNPAGMAFVGRRIDAGVHWKQQLGRTTITGNENQIPIVAQDTDGSFNAFKTKDSYPFNLSGNWTFGACDQFSLGVIAYEREYFKTGYNRTFLLLGTSHLGFEYLHNTAGLNFAWRFNDCHAIGVTLNYHFQRLKVNGLENFDNDTFSSHPGYVTNRGYDYSTGWGVTLGYYGRFFKCVDVGITYQPEGYMSCFHRYKGLIADKGKFDTPEKLSCGIAYHVNKQLTLTADAEYYAWADVRMFDNPINPNLSLSLLPDYAHFKLGEKDGAGFGWQDQTFFRFGAEWRMNRCWTFRAGYRYARDPIPRSQSLLNMLTMDIIQNVTTVGVTWKYNPCNEISAYYAYGFESSQTGKDAIPAFFGGGDVRLKLRQSAMGLSWGRIF